MKVNEHRKGGVNGNFYDTNNRTIMLCSTGSIIVILQSWKTNPMKHKSLLVFSILFVIVEMAFAGNLGRIKKLLEKGDFEKAEKAIQKEMEKNPTNPGNLYFQSVLFLKDDYSSYNIDSAQYYWQQAQTIFDSTKTETVKELQEVGLDQSGFQLLFNRISAAAYARTTTEMSVIGFESFLKTYKESKEADRALFIRDSLAYDIATIINTWQSYKNYYETYPESSFIAQARINYQNLIFESYTEDGSVEGYIRFLNDHPTSPYRQQAEQIIFDLKTAKYRSSDYKWFLEQYPNSKLAKKINDILYYKALDENPSSLEWAIKHHVNPDSLRRIETVRARPLIPIYDQGKFGFMDLNGTDILAPSYSAIAASYVCGNVSSEWLEVKVGGKQKIVNRLGDVIYDDYLSLYQVNNTTYLLKGDKSLLYHASGFAISQKNIEAAISLNNGWISYQQGYDWGLMLPNGTELTAPEYSSIKVFDSLVILEKDGLFAIVKAENLLNQDVEILFVYDDYEFANDSLLFVYNEDQEGLFDLQLNPVYPLSSVRIHVENGFIYLENKDGIEIINSGGLTVSNGSIEDILINAGWLAIQSDSLWTLISRNISDSLRREGLDSVRLMGKRCAYIETGSMASLLFDNGIERKLKNNFELSLLKPSKSKNNVSYLLINKGMQLEVLSMDGVMMFGGKYKAIMAFSDSTFRVTSGSKMGLMDKKGKELLRAKYDLIDEQDGMVFLLQDAKIGGFDLRYGAIISSKYEARIERIDSGLYKVKTAGKQGIIDARENFRVSPNYDELLLWNDTSLWVRSGEIWSLVSMENESLITDIKSLKPWIEVGDEQLLIAFGEDGYGLYSDQRGEILSMQYNEIINVGTSETPVFFAEQHLKAASLFVVTYFDFEGNTIRSQAYRPEEYDQIYCDK